MSFIEMLLLAVGLSMDCFAVAASCGVRLDKPRPAQALRLGAAFGFAQGFMPVVGWLAGSTVVSLIKDYDHWIAFALLAFVGIKMIREYFEVDHDESKKGDPTKGRELFILSVATSIDALAVGLSLAFLGTRIFLPAFVIGVSCFCITVFGVYLGVRTKDIWGRRMELVGGVVLIGIGVKVLIG